MILFFVGFIIYALMRCLPSSFIENMARQKSMQPGSKSFDEWMAQLNAMYNMDKSIIPGYFSWLGTAIRGEFGDSWLYTVPVLEKFNDCVWLSFVMGGIAFILEILIAVPLGVIAATKQYSKADYTISIIALAGISLPTFFFASLLKLVFSVKLGWFDLFGLVGRNYNQLSAWGQVLDKANHLVLPILTLVCFEALMSWVTLKSLRMRRIISGRPKIVVRDGQIEQATMQDLRLSVDDLMTALRQQQVFDISQVQFAVMETTGTISVYLKAECQPLTPADITLKKTAQNPPVAVIQDGCVMNKSLAMLGKNQAWLEQKLAEHRLTEKQVFLMLSDAEGTCTIIPKKRGDAA